VGNAEILEAERGEFYEMGSPLRITWNSAVTPVIIGNA
jgi:hypothetical protein